MACETIGWVGLPVRFLRFFLFFKIQKNIKNMTFYVFLSCLTRFLEHCSQQVSKKKWRLWSWSMGHGRWRVTDVMHRIPSPRHTHCAVVSSAMLAELTFCAWASIIGWTGGQVPPLFEVGDVMCFVPPLLGATNLLFSCLTLVNERRGVRAQKSLLKNEIKFD